MRTPLRPTALFILLLLAMGVSFASFQLRGLEVSISLNPDGTAHATEIFRLFLDNAGSVELYQSSFVYNDLSSWNERTNISDLRTHVSFAYADLRNLRVRPQPVDSCNTVADTCYATLALDYDIYPLSANQTGILNMDPYKPRTIRYDLRPEGLTFPRSKAGDILLPKEATLRLSVPDEASRITFSRAPDNLGNETAMFRFDPRSSTTYYTGRTRQFIWAGETLSQFSLAYEIEQPLDSEIVTFFAGLQRQVFSTAFSIDGLAYLLAGASLLLAVLWLHKLKA